MRRRLPILLALIVAAAAALSLGTAPAMAAKPCWKQLINDWYDGRIDKSYPVSCYRQAIKNLPEDVAAYSRAREDINRALLAAIRAGERAGAPLGPRDRVPPEPKTSTEPELEGEAGEEIDATPPINGDNGGVLDTFKPTNADSIPLPLIILAGLALVLLAAATAGFVARRIQARRVRVSPGPPDAGSP